MIWYTWLGFFGLIFGILASGVLQTPMLRSALVGFAAGIALVIVVNAVMPQPAPCLQSSKGWDIVRAHWICR